MENIFKCKANNGGYCNMWKRDTCCGDCKQSYCGYCINAAISPNIENYNPCINCTQYEWKKENYQD